jgi:ribonucleoside-triphosphate reductase
LAPLGQSRIMRVCVRLFRWRPWWTIVFFAFSPIPFYPIRLVAPLAGYPLTGYVSAVVVGRVPRYFLIALGGVWAKRLTESFLPL